MALFLGIIDDLFRAYTWMAILMVALPLLWLLLEGLEIAIGCYLMRRAYGPGWRRHLP